MPTEQPLLPDFQPGTVSAGVSCTRRLQFCAGHRVLGHENKCGHLHGHNYVVLLTAQAAALDAIGRVIDFSVLKARFGKWIDDNWDHGMIICAKDHAAQSAISEFNSQGTVWQKTYWMADNPTAENMAQHLLLDVAPGLLEGTGVRLTAVRVWETENCYADAHLEAQ